MQTDDLPPAAGKQFQRFPPIWRLAHLLFALSLMMLTLTGMSLFYADTRLGAMRSWSALGGPKIAALIHRICAVIFAGVFVWHLVYIVLHVGAQLADVRAGSGPIRWSRTCRT